MTGQRGRIGEHEVRRIGYGAMQLAEGTPPDRGDAIAVLRRAVELGVDHIDTAEFYGDGLANDLIRAALWPYPDDLALVSKVGAVRAGTLVPAQRPEELRAGVEANLRRLGVERLAAVNLRRLDAPPGIVATVTSSWISTASSPSSSPPGTKARSTASGSAGSAWTSSGGPCPRGSCACRTCTTCSTAPPSRCSRECAAHGVAWVPFFPLGSAFPGAPRVAEHPAVVAAAADLGVTPAQVGLAWLLANDPGTLLIPGTRSVEHLAENVAAAEVHLDATTLSRFDS